MRDALRFLHEIARGYNLAEIIGEKYVGGQPVWSGIRGGTRETCFSGESELPELFGSVCIDMETWYLTSMPHPSLHHKKIINVYPPDCKPEDVGKSRPYFDRNLPSAPYQPMRD